jgi:hypothetical protein
VLRNLFSRMRSMVRKESTEVGHDSGKERTSATGATLRALLSSCPICKKSIKGHCFAQVASTIVNDSSKPILARLLSSVRQHEWGHVTEFKEWDALSDNLIVYVISGDHPDSTILVVKDVFELYASNDLILMERITNADIAAISNQVTLEWRQM